MLGVVEGQFFCEGEVVASDTISLYTRNLSSVSEISTTEAAQLRLQLCRLMEMPRFFVPVGQNTVFCP